MYLPKPSGGDYEIAPAGTHIGIAFRLLDLGTQRTTYKGEERFVRQVMLSWELCDELMKDGRPFTIDKRYTFSTHQNSALRKDLEAWRGVKFTEQELSPGNPARFNLKSVLGKACQLMVTHDKSDDGSKTYANASTAKLHKDMKPKPLKNPIVYLTFDDWEPEVFGSLSQYLQGLIAKSPEFSQLSNADHGIAPEQHADEDVYDDANPPF